MPKINRPGLSDEIVAARNYLGKFSREYARTVRPNSHTLETGSSHLPPITYRHLLGSIMYALDPVPRKDEEYAARLKRVLTGKRILELGARRGVFIDFLRKHGAEAEGIDANDSAASVARERGVPVHTGKIEDLTNKKFDLVVSFQFFDPGYWGVKKTTEIARNAARLLLRKGHGIHVVLNHESTIERSELENAGLRVLKHEAIEPDLHVSIAQKR